MAPGNTSKKNSKLMRIDEELALFTLTGGQGNGFGRDQERTEIGVVGSVIVSGYEYGLSGAVMERNTKAGRDSNSLYTEPSKVVCVARLSLQLVYEFKAKG